MKKFNYLFCVLIMAVFAGCGAAQDTVKENEVEKSTETVIKDESKVLVAYYSYTGNTKDIAEKIKGIVKGDIFRIIPEKEYTRDYQEVIEVAKDEINREFKPKLDGKVENIDEYDILFIGSPNWWSTIAPPVASFLSGYNLSGKIVVPFVSHGGGGKARCINDIEKLCPESKLLKGLAIYENNYELIDLMKWLEEIGILKK